MPYTLWSKDRLLGESELDYARSMPKHRMGDFTPTEMGEKLMPVLTGVRKALIDVSRSRAERISEGYSEQRLADAAEATAHFEGLELELRAPDGTVVPTEWIGIQDTEWLLALSDQAESAFDDVQLDPAVEAEIEAAVQHDLELLDEHFAAIERDGPPDFGESEHVFPRYQIQVGLLDDAAMP